MFSKVWTLVFLPLMFALIGNEIDFKNISLDSLGTHFLFKFFTRTLDQKLLGK
jgi:hypothetical protein